MLKARRRGFTIVELLISLAVLAIMLALGAPSFAEWLQNQQIRVATEAVLNGLQVARAEAVRRNTPVRFQFVSDFTASCTLASNTSNWVVSLTTPVAACNVVPSDTTAPQILQERLAAEGTNSAVLTAVDSSGNAASAITFNAIGGVTANAEGTTAIAKIDITNPQSGAPRPLRIVVTGGGSIRMCDPAVAAPDPRVCP
jgi:type IV fimbrial biogenesis protein FimT